VMSRDRWIFLTAFASFGTTTFEIDCTFSLPATFEGVQIPFFSPNKWAGVPIPQRSLYPRSFVIRLARFVTCEDKKVLCVGGKRSLYGSP